MRAMMSSALTGLLLAGLTAAGAWAQESRSAEPARALVQLLQSRGVDVAAARDPEDPNRFVAAMHLSGTLLVVSAVYSVPVLLEQRIERGEHREVYMDLQGAANPEGRLFVEDLQANGLHLAADPGQPFDIVFEHGRIQTTFNGDWSGQGLTESEYRSRFASADARYAKMLTALASALRLKT